MITIVMQAIRRQMGWTRRRAACVLGVSVGCIRRVERGKQKLQEDAAKRLSEATGAKLSRLL